MLVCLVCSFLSASLSAQNSSDRLPGGGDEDIRAEQIRAHIRFLADSLLQGRAPGTPGYDIAARYVATELEGMGLHPGVSGNWFQSVPLEKAVTDAAASSVVLTVKARNRNLPMPRTMFSRHGSPVRWEDGPSRAEIDVSAPIVFVGFGVTAPDQNYDDYAGVDVRGKIVANIYGAPSAFPSTERAYYSDGTVKAKNAVAHGAVGHVVDHAA